MYVDFCNTSTWNVFYQGHLIKTNINFMAERNIKVTMTTPKNVGNKKFFKYNMSK